MACRIEEQVVQRNETIGYLNATSLAMACRGAAQWKLKATLKPKIQSAKLLEFCELLWCLDSR